MLSTLPECSSHSLYVPREICAQTCAFGPLSKPVASPSWFPRTQESCTSNIFIIQFFFKSISFLSYYTFALICLPVWMWRNSFAPSLHFQLKHQSQVVIFLDFFFFFNCGSHYTCSWIYAYPIRLTSLRKKRHHPHKCYCFESLFGHRCAFIVKCLRSAGGRAIAACEVTLASCVWTVFSFRIASTQQHLLKIIPLNACTQFF